MKILSAKINILILLLVAFQLSLSSGRTVLGSASSVIANFGIEPCTDNADCSVWTNATCIDGFCSCDGTKNCPEIAEEVKVNVIAGSCTSDAACNIETATCHMGQCACPSDRVPSLDKRKCLLVAKGLRGECEENVQCQTKEPNSECRHNKCACQDQMHEVEGVCYKYVGLGESCNVTEECLSIPFTQCKLSKCACQENYVQSAANNQCLHIADHIDADCQENSQCATSFGAAVCQGGHCNCEKLYEFKYTKQRCYRDKRLGDMCMTSTECYEPNTDDFERLECIQDMCKCKSSYEEVNGYCTISSAQIVSLPKVIHLVLGVVLFLLCEY